MNSKTVNLSLILLTFTLCLLALGTRPVHAQGISLSTYPSTIQLRAEAKTEAKAGFMIENKSSNSVKLKVALKPFKADTTNDGKLIYIEGNDPAIFKQIQILDKEQPVASIELGPKQSKQLSLQIAIGQHEPDTDYYFSIIFLADEPNKTQEASMDATAQSYAQAGIAMNVLLHVGPKETPHGYLEEFSTPQFRTAGPVPFIAKIKNNGNHYFTPKGVILIKNIFGQTVGRIDLQNANILASTSRSLIGIPYDKSASADQSKKQNFSSQLPMWPEKFLLGYYTAELSVALSEEGPVLTNSVQFLAIPLHVLIGIAITALLILFVSLRIRRRLREV